MCCGLVCAAAGAVAGIAAFFSTAAISSHLFPAATGAGAAASAAAADATAGALAAARPLGAAYAGAAKLLPDSISAIGQVSGKMLLAEHCLFMVMLAWWAAAWTLGAARRAAAPRERRPLKELSEIQRLLDQIRTLKGPDEVLAWGDVIEAPAPTMDMGRLEDGQAASHADGRGAIYRFKLHGETTVNMYFTNAGHMRSGDLHDCNQYDVVLKGRVRLTMKDPRTGQEQVAEYGHNDFIIIPARWPHLFEFLEDNCLLEWWDGPFKAWYYAPMRQLIDERARQQQGKDDIGGGRGNGGGGGGGCADSTDVQPARQRAHV